VPKSRNSRAKKAAAAAPKPDRFHAFFHGLGPGIVTGAADDDPSGISTYSVAGAAFGPSLLWTVLLTFPLMTAVQTMCARLALVTGEGLAATLRRHSPTWVLWGACLLLAVANVINIGADLAGMGEALELVTGVHERIWPPLLAAGIVAVLVFWSYRHLARVLKWTTLVLFAYVVAAFLAKPEWGEALRATFVPRLAWEPRYLATLVAILGTTITPYMFFWQAAQEVEEERAQGKRGRRARRGATDEDLAAAQGDILAGMGWAGLAMYFIILTTATTLHAAGTTEIATAQQAAEALRPMAGDAAYLLFALGLVGTGLLAVPVLAGSAAYAVAEAMHWRASLDDRPRVGAKFYLVLALAVLLGLGMDMLEVDAVQALFYAAIVNGVLAPPLVVLVTLLTSDERVMGNRVNPPLLRWLGWATFAIMLGAAAALGLAKVL
jgi:NRAMP (natural resistance-associated macrophage protein)-like metal ion transporter